MMRVTGISRQLSGVGTGKEHYSNDVSPLKEGVEVGETRDITVGIFVKVSSYKSNVSINYL